jgi:hypothetical protein
MDSEVADGKAADVLPEKSKIFLLACDSLAPQERWRVNRTWNQLPDGDGCTDGK